ncbi:MAG: transposase, partial [Bacteroidetes bacterium]
MENVLTSIFIQIIFSVKGRKNLIPQENLEEVFESISGIIRNKGLRSLSVGGVSSHVHVFIELKPEVVVDKLVKDIKNSSAKFINEGKWVTGKFSWHNDYG